MRAVDTAFDEQTEFLKKLCRFPSVRGQKQAIQHFLADALRSRRYETDVWQINAQELERMAGFSQRFVP
ncbi:hypothetical protein X747_31905 [Mesorhizobium sp. LNJC384A00]|uniref:hypothetical protein n=1 Tax=Mesorhizobium sp. LNJC384A00 TaxID=1287268 RepID=UPI0003CF5523|nr:hypothetical protein [Mesorhizobium sp. LNJC384A00]ESY30752.1 hypothetical protein X747_31905 [Mesorhizobium sp. LNJC384A00]